MHRDTRELLHDTHIVACTQTQTYVDTTRDTEMTLDPDIDTYTYGQRHAQLYALTDVNMHLYILG